MVKWLVYEFEVYQHDGKWSEVSGLYIFSGLPPSLLGSAQWRPLYIGQTQDFSARIPTHPSWPEAVRLGATHVHARVELEAKQRALIERALIDAYHPPLNVQLK